MNSQRFEHNLDVLLLLMNRKKLQFKIKTKDVKIYGPCKNEKIRMRKI
jgi:hypothetical protein